MAEEYKNQHIVPQSYLNRFAVKIGKKHIIGTRLTPSSKRNISFFTRSVADVGYIEYYYDTCAQQDKKYWEHYLDNEFDSLCGTPLDNIVAKITLAPPQMRVLADEDKAILSRIILSQSIRVPAYLDEQVEDAQITLDSYKADMISAIPDDRNDIKEGIKQISFSYDERKNMILEGMFNEKRFARFCRVLQNKVWIVFVNGLRLQMPFITSDNPVLFSDIKGKSTKMPRIGIANDKTVILYPVTPSILIGLYSKEAFWGEIQKFDGCKLIIDDMKFITKVNVEIMAQSYIHSFLPEPLFTMVKDIK